jgi:hypothetical protein
MNPPLSRPPHQVIGHDDLLVHEWRVKQLTQLGIPWLGTYFHALMPGLGQ